MFPFTNQQILDFVVADRDLNDAEYDALFEFYLNNNLMPYGIAKAREGDPYQFIADDLNKRFDALIPTDRDVLRYRDYEIKMSLDLLAPLFGYTHASFDGEGDNRYGYADTLRESISEIDEQIDA